MYLLGLPLELFLSLINLSIILIFLYMFLYNNTFKYKLITNWLLILFLLNLINLRFTIKSYLTQSQVIGNKGGQGRLGDRGDKGEDVCCSNSEIVIDLKNKANEWSNHILKYDQGANFLSNYFYVEKNWDNLLSKDETKNFQETENPFVKIKQDDYWKPEILNILLLDDESLSFTIS